MKKNKFVLLTTTGLLLVGLAGVKASAEEAGKDLTDTTVEIKDQGEEDDDDFSLEHVPSNFTFKTVVKNKNYELDTDGISGNKTIDVFNNNSARDWKVKAEIENISKDSTTEFMVNSFKIGDVEVQTGSEGIVHKAGEKNKEDNTGLIPSKEIEKISILFTDNKNILKAGDTLSGIVKYTLSATPSTK